MAVMDRVTTDTQAQARMQELLDNLTRSGEETGIQAAAYLDGQLVVDAWSGMANPAADEPVRSDTLFIAFSCSKGVTSTVIHQLVEAGKVDYDDPIADYWPEFAAKGKGGITLRHALRHEAGIPQTPKGVTPERLADWDWMVHKVENLKPLWKPGANTAYHGLTFGVILGELARRVDGRPFAQIVQEDICQPLGINDLYFGVPPEAETRIATIGGKRAPFAILPSIFLVKRVIPNNIDPSAIWNQPAIWHGVIPAGNMTTTARSLAQHYAALIGDGVDGVKLLPPERVKIASALATDKGDKVFFGSRIRKGLGYFLGGNGFAFGSRKTVFGHTGAGGAIAFADPEYNFSFALLKNQMSWRGEEDTDYKVAHAIREALGIPD